MKEFICFLAECPQERKYAGLREVSKLFYFKTFAAYRLQIIDSYQYRDALPSHTGEFSKTALLYEGSGPPSSALSASAGDGVWEGVSRGEKLLGSQSSVLTFTKAFRELAAALQDEADVEAVTQSLITVDGGPHTLWWYVIRFCAILILSPSSF